MDDYVWEENAMSELDPKFSDLLQRVREGSQDAFFELVTTFSEPVLLAVRRRLGKKIRSKFDSDDFVQAVWATFFEHRVEMTSFATPQDLTQFLARIASNKVIDTLRRQLKTDRRNVNREESLESSDIHPIEGTAPTGSEVAIARERWFRLVDGQPAECVEVAKLRLVGATRAEVAQQLGVSEKTVQRILKRLRHRLQQ
jgi:RNA polymerase sigma factor (sigma-70 family)